MAADSPSAPRSVRAAARVADLLNALQQAPDGIGLRDISRAVGMPKSTALRYLATLEASFYVDRDAESGVYRLGLAIPPPTQLVAALQEAVRPSLERLRDRFGETGGFTIFDGTGVTVVDVAESRQAIRMGSEIGARWDFHSTAMGKALAATFPDRFIRHFVESGGLKRFTPNTITDASRFYAELEEIRSRGYATTEEENELGSFGVGVTFPTRKVRAAIGLAGPASRVDPESVPAMADSLRGEAKSIVAAFDARLTELAAGVSHEPFPQRSPTAA